MKFLPDARLYDDVEYCLRFSRAIAPAAEARNETTLFHFYWSGTFGRKAAFALKSFLATQNPARSRAWLWLDVADRDEEGNPLLSELEPFISVRLYAPSTEARGTPFENAPHLVMAKGAAARSDAFRLIALYKYGGLYVDLDTLFLRDFAALIDAPYGAGPFCYRWSGRCDYSTNAIMFMRRGHPLGSHLMNHAIRVNSCHPRILLRHEDHPDIDLVELPCAFFDPLWPHFDGNSRYASAPFDRFRDFFRPFGFFYRQKPQIREMKQFFPGAFAYQWHGLWKMREYTASYFGMFEDEVSRAFLTRRGDWEASRSCDTV